MTRDGGHTQRRMGPRSEQGSDPAVSIETLHEQLRQAIESIETGEQWRAWLDFARNLHQYSFNNLVLIWAQRPDATAVAGYATWQSLNRQVRRGEKALRVMAPIIRRAVVNDENGHPILGSDGRRQLKQQIIGFRPAPVFEVSQTDGPPIPEPTRPTLLSGHAPAGLWDALASEVSQHGYRLMRGSVSQLGGANGVTRINEREVWVRVDVDAAQAAKTLAHELAHVMLHVEPQADGTAAVCEGIREVEAESVAHLVMAAHHVDTGAYSFPYVATWAYPLAALEHVPMADIVARTGNRVMKAASEIIAITAPAVGAAADATTQALTVRVTAAAQQTAELRDQATAAALPPVDKAVLLGVVSDSHAFFRRQVGPSWVPDYLSERHLADAIRSHQLGYAPKRWTVLTDHLRTLGYTDDHIEGAGVATRARNGHLIDRFRDRLTIPLRDKHGELVGFTARLGPHHTEGQDGPKYLNSPTTTIFRKSELLYGFGEHAIQVANGHLPVLCEGPLDAIAIDLLAREMRFSWVGVAASGTAFTQHHARHLVDAVGDRPICVAFDADRAGQAAAEAAWRQLTDLGPREVIVADFPPESDPASLFAAEAETLRQCVGAARPAASVIADWQISSANLDGNFLREMAAFRELMSLADRMPTWQRPSYLIGLADRLHIDPTDAASEIGERRPNMLMDRTIEHCHRLDDALRTAVPEGEMLAQPDAGADLARTSSLTSTTH